MEKRLNSLVRSATVKLKNASESASKRGGDKHVPPLSLQNDENVNPNTKLTGGSGSSRKQSTGSSETFSPRLNGSSVHVSVPTVHPDSFRTISNMTSSSSLSPLDENPKLSSSSAPVPPLNLTSPPGSSSIPPPPPLPGLNNPTGRPGGPPPPPGSQAPPPLPLAESGLPPKKLIKPNKKMRGLMWVKLPNKSIPTSIWKNIDDERQTLDAREIEELFGVDPEEKKPLTPRENATDTTTLRTSVSLIDPKRSNNIEIMLRSLKMNHIEIKNALLSMDSEKVFTPERLKSLQSNLPTSEEMALIEGYDGDKTELGNAEKYFMAIGKIPMLALRVDALAFKANFDNRTTDLDKTLSTLLSAISLVSSNKKFHTLLELILALGNYINGSTNRGQTHGFKLSSLAKLGDVRSPKQPTLSLMNYLAEFVSSRHENIFNCILKEFSPIHEAAREDTTELSKQVTQLESQILPIKNHLNSSICDSPFAAAMSSWLPTAEQKISQLSSKNTSVQKGMTDLLLLYGEPSNTKSDEFFGNLSSFANAFEQSYYANEKKKHDSQPQLKTKTTLRKTSKTNLISSVSSAPELSSSVTLMTSPPTSPVAASPSLGEFDRLLQKMKNGQVFMDKEPTHIK